MTEAFAFQELDGSKSQIRVLDILPSEQLTDPINGQLRIVSLDDLIEYEALSWCWGDASIAASIYINGLDFECSPNLEAALRYLRDPHEVKTFWVDATCINQQDLREKSSQVVMMTRIYGGARCVRIWLGQSTDGSDDAMSMMEEIMKVRRLRDHRLNGVPVSEDMVLSLCLLLERPWWERIWVMQELALAQQAIFHCGRASFDPVDFPEAIDEMVEAFAPAFVPFQHIQSDTIKTSIVRLTRAFLRIMPSLEAMNMARRIKQPNFGLRHTVDLIIHLSGLKSTDPRDKVYGCLALLPELSKLIVPDYTMFVDVTYTITTWTLIVYTSCFYPLCFVRPRRTVELRGETITFPSWTLDFAQNSDKRPKLFWKYSCCGPWGPFSTQIRFPYLETPAVFFDEITACYGMKNSWGSGWTSVNHARCVHTEWRSFFGLELDRSDHSAYIGGGSVENAYWRLVAGDLCYYEERTKGLRRLNARQIRSFVRWVRNPANHTLTSPYHDWEVNKIAMEYWYSVHYTSFGNNTFLFKTRKGYMGLAAGVPDIHVGDHLYLLDRGEVPWALRPCHDEVEGTTFEVISECYVHGLMDGEAFERRPTSDSKAWKRHDLRRKLFGGDALDSNLPLPPWSTILLT